MSELFLDIMRGFLEFAEMQGRERELFPKIIKAVGAVAGNCGKDAECECSGGEIYIVKTDHVRAVTDNLFKVFYGFDSREEENAIFDCRLCGRDEIKYSDYLFAYKKRNFDEIKDRGELRRANEKNFRVLLNEYIINFQPKKINEKKNLWLSITPHGEFMAIKKFADKSIIYDLSANERTLFNLLCFIETNAFKQLINGVRDFNYKERPLFIINSFECLSEEFDFIAFLKAQKLNRKIILIDRFNVPKTPH